MTEWKAQRVNHEETRIAMLEKCKEAETAARVCLELPQFKKYKEMFEQYEKLLVKSILEDKFPMTLDGVEAITEHKNNLTLLRRLIKWVNIDAREKNDQKS